MGRDFWNTIREAVKIGPIKGSLTIPAGTFNCGFPRASVYSPPSLSPIRNNGLFGLSSTEITIDFWAKLLIADPLFASVSVIRLTNGTQRISLTTDNVSGTMKVTAVTTGGTYTANLSKTYYHAWHRFTITFSSVNNILKLYVDSTLESSIVTTGNLGANNFDIFFGSSSVSNDNPAYFNELALYTKEMTKEEVIQTNSYRANIGAYGQFLSRYWKMNNVGAVSILTPSVGGIFLLIDPAQLQEVVTTEYAPIKFGASFIAVQYDVALTYKTSVQFPKNPPVGMTGQIVLRWLDDAGVVQRRKLWTLTGVDIAPSPAVYNGERLAKAFTIEVWNVDGAATVVIPSDIILWVAKTTKPTTSYDMAAVASSIIIADSTLASSAYPLVFPITFNNQQTYTP